MKSMDSLESEIKALEKELKETVAKKFDSKTPEEINELEKTMNRLKHDITVRKELQISIAKEDRTKTEKVNLQKYPN